MLRCRRREQLDPWLELAQDKASFPTITFTQTRVREKSRDIDYEIRLGITLFWLDRLRFSVLQFMLLTYAIETVETNSENFCDNCYN